jgi:hypothetical protein
MAVVTAVLILVARCVAPLVDTGRMVVLIGLLGAGMFNQ